MKSKFVLLAATLTLLSTATPLIASPPLIADGTSNTDVKTNKTEDKAMATGHKEEAKPDKKSKIDETMSIKNNRPVFYFLADPCLTNPNLPGCPGRH